MSASVTVRAKAFGDSRIVFLAKLLGCSWNDAFIRLIRLWSVCAEQQTDKPEVRHIRACLEDIQGEKHLVESGLGDTIADPNLVVVRVRGCDETDWYYAKLELEGQAEAGRARAATAIRDARGRFVDPGGDRSSQTPASLSPDSDLISGSGSDLPASKLPESGGEIVRAERGSLADQHTVRIAGRSNADLRNKLVNAAWNYAALVHTQLKSDGIDPNARNVWSGTNIAEARKMLVAIVADMTQGDEPNWKAAEDTIRNRVDVAAAEARRDHKAGQQAALRWFTPMRMWDAKSFARGAELTPEQAGTPRHQAGERQSTSTRRVVAEDAPPPLPPAIRRGA